MVIGDGDGVVTIPFDEIDAVITALDDIRAAESSLGARVAGGLGVPPSIEEMFEDGRVVEIDKPQA